MEKAKVFVIMPFSEDFFESYELIKEKFNDEFEFTHAGDMDNQQNILADIIPPIYNADVVLADLTDLNPNVMYELGIAHCLNKKTIVITRDELSKLPFDLKQYRAKAYSTHFKQFYDLLSYLDKHLHGAIDGSVIFNNPVGDFLDKNKIDPTLLFNKDNIRIDAPDSDMGFIDFIAEIEESTQEFTKSIYDISSEVKTMSAGIDSCTQEINRVKKTGGSGNASFIRKQSRKVAEYMDVFSTQLRAHNALISPLWSQIETNTYGLLENEYSQREENRESLIKFLKALFGMQVSIKQSNQSVRGMKESSLKNLGIERSLNQAIRSLDEDLKSYLATTEQMITSIDRMLSKAKFIVGNVDFQQEDQEDA